MKNILCFGDSNTWGFNGEGGERFPHEQRWTSLLQKNLGPDYNIIPEGINGRTTVWEDPFKPCRNGAAFLPYGLLTHAPLDLVVIMLGTNDSKNYFRNSPFAIGKGIRTLIEMIQVSDAGRGGNVPEILILSPSPVAPGIQEKASFDIREFADIDGHDPLKVSRGLAAEYRRRADEYGCAFLNAGESAGVCPEDGIHLTADGHGGLAKAVAAKIREMGL
ncbi:MAG: SGNH/GDSL hydrolase family protein [Spirochaetales bacterium]|nr:SGNH/GDSL hydrolase family protein [Spirochaetales bacterium]